MVCTPRIMPVSVSAMRSRGQPSSHTPPRDSSSISTPLRRRKRKSVPGYPDGWRRATAARRTGVESPCECVSRLPSWPAGQVDHLIPRGRWEGVLERDVAVVLRAGDRELRTARGDRLDRFAARSHNGRLAVHAAIACRRWRVPSRNHHPTLIRQQLRFDIAYGYPTDARPLVDQPIVLAVREKVPRHRFRHGHLEPRTDRCHKRRAVARGTWLAADWVACLPAHILARQPVALNVHRIELLG